MKMILNLKSRNKKVGPIPVSMSGEETCPNSCPMKDKGCYAKYGPLSWHWKKVEAKGMEWDKFIHAIKALPEGLLWRHNQAGDLAGDGKLIDQNKLIQLTEANKGLKGFTYTHYRGFSNFEKISRANEGGFTINLSANGAHEVDELVSLNIGPVVTIMPLDFKGMMITKAGNTIVECPAVAGTVANCKECGACQVVGRKSVIGFPAHGVGKKYLEAIQEN